MNKAVKAALLSAFIFPGAGHVFLRCYVAAVLFAVISFAAFYVLLVELVSRAQSIVDKILQGEVQIDIAALSELLIQQPGVGNDGPSPAVVVLIIFWLASIADAYRLGRGQDRIVAIKQQRKNIAG